MVHSSPPRDDRPAPVPTPGQLSLFALDEMGAWIVRRLSMGDDVVLCDDGTWFVGPPGSHEQGLTDPLG